MRRGIAASGRGWTGPATAAAAIAGALWLAGCESLPKVHMPHMPIIQSPPACADFSISIYFEPRSSVVTPEAQALIASAAHHARRCQVQGVDVVGLADGPGVTDANLQLSKDRAAAVTSALTGKGVEHVDINATALDGAGDQPRRGLVRPLRRRVDVTFHLAQRTRA